MYCENILNYYADLTSLPDLQRTFQNTVKQGINDMPYYLHSDRLGSATAVTNQNGNAEQILCFQPWGEDFLDLHNAYETPYQVFGYEADAESSLNYANARYYMGKIGKQTFNSTDPMWYKKPWQSSYLFCSNDPINRRDPDGKDDWKLNYETGCIDFVKKTKANTHTIYASKANGKIDRKNSITVSKDVLNSSTQQTVQANGETYTTNTYTIFNEEQAESFFEFAANNSNVEWTNVSASYTDNSGTTNYSLVTTSHKYGTDVSINGIMEQMEHTNYIGAITQNGTYQINKVDHNHPNGSTTPSGQPLRENRASKDIGMAQRVNRLNGNNNAIFRIYTHQSRSYHSFSANDTPWILREIEVVAPRIK